MRALVIVLVTVGSMPFVAVAGDAGRSIYVDKCSPCHGDDGRGDGPAAPALVPRPRNFRDPGYWNDHTAAEQRAIIKRGKPGTMMPPYDRDLDDAQIDAVVDFLRRFDPRQAAASPKAKP